MKKTRNTLILIFLLSAVVRMAAAPSLLETILTTARRQVGTPYVFGGIQPGGFDCSGFIYYLFRPHIPDIPRVSAYMAEKGVPVGRNELNPGDLVFFATGSSSSQVTHVALFLGQDTLVHAISDGPNRGVTITSLTSRYWNQRYHHARRILSEKFHAGSPEPPAGAVAGAGSGKAAVGAGTGPAAGQAATGGAAASTASGIGGTAGTESAASASATVAGGGVSSGGASTAGTTSATSTPPGASAASANTPPGTSAPGGAAAASTAGTGTAPAAGQTPVPAARIEDLLFVKGRYSGEVVNMQPEGFGRFTMNNGDYYEGQFADGVFHGQGKYVWADGAVYEGRFNRGRMVSGTRKTYLDVFSDDWDTWEGIIRGDFELWYQEEQKRFQDWQQKK